MKWLRDIEGRVVMARKGFGLNSSLLSMEEAKQLIAAVKLAEKKAHKAEKAMDLSRNASARLELSELVTRLRSGDVEASASELKPTHDVTRLSRAEFDALLDYSCSTPTGQTVGKRWKCNVHAFTLAQAQRVKKGEPPLPPEWWMAEYVERDAPGMIGIKWTKIEVEEAQ